MLGKRSDCKSMIGCPFSAFRKPLLPPQTSTDRLWFSCECIKRGSQSWGWSWLASFCPYYYCMVQPGITKSTEVSIDSQVGRSATPRRWAGRHWVAGRWARIRSCRHLASRKKRQQPIAGLCNFVSELFETRSSAWWTRDDKGLVKFANSVDAFWFSIEQRPVWMLRAF